MRSDDEDSNADPTQLPPALLARAETALAALAGDYLIWVERDCAAARACLDEARLQPDPADALQRFAAIIHDIKGQASTFGYPLISRIGAILLLLLKSGESDCGRLSRHVDAMSHVAQNRLTGDGGARGREILDGLD